MKYLHTKLSLRRRAARSGATLLALLPLSLLAQSAPPEADASGNANQLEQITVTGSRIPRAQVEGPAPVTVIKASDIDAGGYRSVFDVLTQINQNTGSVQGEDFGSTFTPAANVINLRGLGPNHTLVLLNGHRVADYPVAYDGSVNAVDLSNIPSVMIDRIEILSGSASAVYGSDAIAGVVNIVLKREYEGADVSVRVGGTQQGGGDNQRLQFIAGHSWGALSGVFGLELTNRDPIFYGDRDLTDSYTRYAAPGSLPGALIGYRDPVSRKYYALPDGGCNAVASLMGGSMTAFTSPKYGTYCSSDHYYSYRTIQTRKQLADAYATVKYALNDTTEAYADFLYGFSNVATTVRSPNWSIPAFWNDATGRLENWTRILAPEEIGGTEQSARSFLQHTYDVTVGIKGTLGSSDWHYEANANRSEYVSHQGRFAFLPGVDDFFLGPSTGTHTYKGVTYPSYDADPSRLITALTPTQFRSISTRTLERDEAWTEDATFSVNGSPLDLPAGPLGLAGVLEAGRQGYTNTPDPRIDEGLIWNQSAASTDHGVRNRYAAGVEANVPIFSRLTATAAARYDNYRYGGRSIGKDTYNLGLEYRPFDSLLARATYATSFRAPDMNYLFAKNTTGYIPNVTDVYQCRLAGQPTSSCDISYNMNFSQSGSLDLKPERGKSFTYGLVWSPHSDLDFSADYYRIRISDEVTNLDENQILRTEADCRLGKTESGTPVDSNSALCRDALARVQRNPGSAAVLPNQVNDLALAPINAASEITQGIDFSANARLDTGRWGKYRFHAGYTHVLKHTYQQFGGDPVRDYLNDVSQQTDWRTKLNAGVGFNLGPWSATLDGTRWGRIPLNDYSGLRGNYTQYNGSVGYEFDSGVRLRFIVNNLTNAMPVDKSAGWPNYSAGWYDAYGRQWWLQFDFRLAGKGGS